MEMEYVYHDDHNYNSGDRIEVFLQEHNFPVDSHFKGYQIPNWFYGKVSGSSADGVNVSVPVFNDISLSFRVGLNALRRRSQPETGQGEKICAEINCPYNFKDGCRRYSGAFQCHLLCPEYPGQKRPGIERQCEQWLFTDGTAPVDMAGLREENQTWLQADEHTALLIEKNREPFHIRTALAPEGARSPIDS